MTQLTVLELTPCEAADMAIKVRVLAARIAGLEAEREKSLAADAAARARS